MSAPEKNAERHGKRPAVVTFAATGPVKLLLLPTPRFAEIVGDNPQYYKDFARLAMECYVVVIRQAVQMAALGAEMRLRMRRVQLAALHCDPSTPCACTRLRWIDPPTRESDSRWAAGPRTKFLSWEGTRATVEPTC